MIKKILKYSVVLLIVLITPVVTIKAKEKTLAEWEVELNKVQKELNETTNKKEQTQKEITAANNKINSIYSRVEKIENDIEAKTKESEKLEKDIKEKNNETEELMRYYQVSSSGSAMLEYIMGAESITDLVYRLSITEQITNYNKKVINEMNQMIKDNDEIKKDLTAKKKELVDLQAELKSQLEVLNKKNVSLDEEGHNLSESVKEMKKTIADLKKRGCKNNETQTTCLNRLYGGTSYLPSGTTFYRPTTTGRMSSNYGWRTLYNKPNFHGAVDISMPIGTPVYAVAPGYVKKTKYWNGKKRDGGTEIVIQHQINGKYYTSYYAHLSSINVSVGQIVTKDTVIGKSGNTGNSTGPHLHLGLATGRWYTDYFSYPGSGFLGHSFDPRDVIVFPAKGSSYYNR